MFNNKLKKIIRDAADKKYTKKIDISFIDGTGLALITGLCDSFRLLNGLILQVR